MRRMLHLMRPNKYNYSDILLESRDVKLAQNQFSSVTGSRLVSAHDSICEHIRLLITFSEMPLHCTSVITVSMETVLALQP